MGKNKDLSLNVDKDSSLRKSSKFLTAVYNSVAILLIVGQMFIFHDSKNGTIILLIYPLLGVCFALISNGLVRIYSDEKNSITGSIMLGLGLNILMMALVSYEDFNLLRANEIWLPIFIISACFFILFYKASNDATLKFANMLTVFSAVLALVYGYGSAKEINCALDNSNPHVYKAEVLNTRQFRGTRSTADYATLAPWGPRQSIKEVEIDGFLYEQIKIGDTVHVNLSNGRLHVPWFVVTK